MVDDIKDRLINVEQNNEWVSALSAVRSIALPFGGDNPAKATIISRLTDGALEGRADILLQEADIGRLDFDDLWRRPLRHPLQREKRYLEFAGTTGDALLVVPTDFFAEGDNQWVLDPTLISWSEGRFVARCPARFRRAFKSRVVVPGSGERLNLTRPRVTPVVHSEAFIRRAVSGLRFRRCDIEAMVAGRPNAVGPAKPEVRGKLPASAKPNDFKHEEYAHKAAEIIRHQRILPERAFWLVAPKGAIPSDASKARAIRHAFDLMYDRKGVPHQD